MDGSLTRYDVSPNSVRKQVVTIQFEIYPIEAESLNQSKHSLAKECIHTERCRVLINNSHNCVAKNKSDKCIGPFYLVLNIDSRVEFKRLVQPCSQALGYEFAGSDEDDDYHRRAGIQEYRDPYESQPLRHRYVYACYPQPCGGDYTHGVGDHYCPDHRDQVGEY